jgi:pimeloyl-ACP methyl ester carboxylesterase
LFLFVSFRWNSVERIKHADAAVPTMVLSGGVDFLISPHQQLEMYEASPANDKELLYSPNMGHK